MDAASALFAIAALGIQWGYQPAEDGTMEYIIQLSPQEAQHLATSPGLAITSDVPDEAQPVGRIRITVGEATPIKETQLRIAKDAQPDADAQTDADAGSGRYDLAELDKDLAGRLVAIPAEPRPAGTAERLDGFQLTMQNGTPVAAAGEGAPEGNGEAESQEPASAESADSPDPINRPQRELPEGVTQPILTTQHEEPTTTAAPVNVPPFDAAEPPEKETARQQASPSDRPGEQGQQPQSDQLAAASDEDRPWLPLAGAIAVACGFLAGNVFQWRSYLSLRKRYLHLLRKTGG